jgi:hypothetical protein
MLSGFRFARSDPCRLTVRVANRTGRRRWIRGAYIRTVVGDRAGDVDILQQYFITIVVAVVGGRLQDLNRQVEPLAISP